MRVSLGLPLCLLASMSLSALAQTPATSPAEAPTPAWQTDMAVRHDSLVKTNGPGTDAALRTQLLTMGMQDQEARGMVNGAPADKTQYTQAANLKDVDTALTVQLKEIVARAGWPTMSLVGDKASQSAMLVLIHSQDHTWQRSLLPQLEQLADAGKIDGSYVATLVDKELVSEGKLQRYGTQFKVVGDHMAMYAVEDPAGLDARRARVFLPPLVPYEQMMSDMYHLKVSKEIVMATAPAAPATTK